jgi:hypothetical protein
MINEVASGEMVQLVRIGFCGASWDTEQLTFYYAHR